MRITTWRFGEIEINDDKIVSFPNGLPGLEDTQKYILLQHEETFPICWLQSIDNPRVSLPVVDPFELFPKYVFDISEEDIQDLQIADVSDLHVVNVLVIPETIEQMTMNLASPVLINIKRNLGKQVIIDATDFPVRLPVFPLIYKKIQEVKGNAGPVQEGK